MGWGTNFKTDVYLNKMTFRTILELEDAIRQEKEEIASGKELLKMYAAASPKDIFTIEEGDTIMYAINSYVDVVITSLIESGERLTKLEMFLEHLSETEEDIMNYYPFKEENNDRRENGTN